MVFSLKSAVKPSKRSRVLVRKETTAAYLFLLPSLIFFLGFVIFPIVLCVWTSFFDSTMNSADVFVGLANYKELFQDKVFLGALKNTLIIVVVSVPITCVFSLWLRQTFLPVALQTYNDSVNEISPKERQQLHSQLSLLNSQLLQESREAVVDYMMPLGLHHIFAWCHHYGL